MIMNGARIIVLRPVSWPIFQSRPSCVLHPTSFLKQEIRLEICLDFALILLRFCWIFAGVLLLNEMLPLLKICLNFDYILLEICWSFAGVLLEFCWIFAGILLEFCWRFAGDLLEICWRFAFALIALNLLETCFR